MQVMECFSFVIHLDLNLCSPVCDLEKDSDPQKKSEITDQKFISTYYCEYL